MSVLICITKEKGKKGGEGALSWLNQVYTHISFTQMKKKILTINRVFISQSGEVNNVEVPPAHIAANKCKRELSLFNPALNKIQTQTYINGPVQLKSILPSVYHRQVPTMIKHSFLHIT